MTEFPSVSRGRGDDKNTSVPVACLEQRAGQCPRWNFLELRERSRLCHWCESHGAHWHCTWDMWVEQLPVVGMLMGTRSSVPEPTCDSGPGLSPPRDTAVLSELWLSPGVSVSL